MDTGGQSAPHKPSLGALLTPELQGVPSLSRSASRNPTVYPTPQKQKQTCFALLQDSDGIPPPPEPPQIPKQSAPPVERWWDLGDGG